MTKSLRSRTASLLWPAVADAAAGSAYAQGSGEIWPQLAEAETPPPLIPCRSRIDYTGVHLC